LEGIDDPQGKEERGKFRRGGNRMEEKKHTIKNKISIRKNCTSTRKRGKAEEGREKRQQEPTEQVGGVAAPQPRHPVAGPLPPLKTHRVDWQINPRGE